ncbi:hypothetical protein [Brucella haematophila]|uniref:Uncharacterized protein n=1 Tax=Brucella haematophila TaxID=419474 RepID=A0ABX1DTL9_9HYPH|nr:hypothetical protein [Brucella haematophila]NKC04912.1 hypothetical protein [Brucella haematophila]TMV04577.1 hypothetical protein FGI60_06790 [Brucella haematophila]
MSFSQIWDAGFKSVMIYIGVVFFWLCFLEAGFPDRGLSVTIMNIAAAVLAIGFFIFARQSCRKERALAEAEIATLMKEVD